ncbi:flotillin family protein [Alteromonas sp. KUL42]|uniref:flotillin family protein n=1 Tax=Alteromonas sp. KUL42 TaxID=2480797 RepID=UPI001036DAF2|nr:flotillin domain-containing protein [Alteromonas sp. KUL42]TAP37170.1 flotillin family protein [Alteromonas sp. KUL42]GEA06597.1 flotillin family protein [Alteromonas sp. KUL42]
MDTIQTSSLPSILFLAGIAVIGLIVVGLIFAKLYKRATKETAFVRTGLGGEKVIKDGGAIVLPVVHEVIPVNMNTLRIEVEKIQKDALITKDRMRVDVKADFYLRVAPNANGISMAAQTLGTRTTRAEEVKKLMESKFVDVLRAVAAEMTMTEMHEQRADFVQKVQQSVANDLEKNGLELESVSLTGFDQTDLQFFNENNAFDAEGRARLAKIIEEKRKETNDIQQENRILIEQRNLAAEKQSLEVKRDEEEARLNQEQVIAFKRQEQKAEIAKQREMKEREEREAEIAKNRAIEAAEIEKSREIETQEIAKRQALEQARIRQQQEVEVSEQIKQIAVAVKSEEESAARAKAAEAEKQKVEKEEAVKTARSVAEAERKKQIEVIDARKEAEREAVGITVEAQAKKEAAENSAAAILTEAKASADAKMLQAEADEKVLAVEAQGKQALYEAENTLKTEQIELQKALAMLKVLPDLVAQAVKPLENIEGIKILQGYGATGGLSGVGGEHTVATSGTGLADQVTQAALNYRANAPLVDSMLREVGLVDKDKGTLDDLVTGKSSFITNAPAKTSEASETSLNGKKSADTPAS